MTPGPKALRQPVERLQQLIETCPPGQRIIVGLVGLPGSGKSTLANSLQTLVNRRLGHEKMLSVGMDGFHLSKKQLASLPNPHEALARRGAPWTFDATGLAQRLRALKTSPLSTVPWPGFEHGVGDPVEGAVNIASHIPLVLVEGLYLLHDADGWNLDGLLDECWFLDVPLPTALQRLQARHMAAWSISAEQAQARIARSDAVNAQLVHSHRMRAHALVDDCVTYTATSESMRGKPLNGI
jgi:pantothenate kinase